MIWVLVCIDMYRYERNFGSFYCNPTILETVSILSKWVNTDLVDDRRFFPAVFIEIQRQGKILPPMRLCSGKMRKTNVKNIFSYDFPRWPVGVKSYHVVLKLLRNHLRPVNKTVPN